MCSLIHKYNVAGPRYTSYPTVPYWNRETFSGRQWKDTVRQCFKESNDSEGISIYIHLPFCERMCTFCGCHKRITKRHELEMPYIQSVLREWQLYCNLFNGKPRIKELHLGGGTPTFFSPDHLKLLISGILGSACTADDFEFSFEGHPNNTSKEHLQALFDMGFTRVSYGVQDYNKSVQMAIHRVQPFENVKKVTEMAREIGYTSVGHDLIFGLPHQKLRHVEHTIAKTRELRPDRIAFYSYAHVPWLKGNGQRGFKDSDLPGAEEKRRQYEEGKGLLARAGYKEIGMDHFALPSDRLYTSMVSGQLHRNFMGYTPTKTRLVVGLGVSAIGDSWYGFAQNVKSLEEYAHLIENDIFPIYRGHILTGEDQIVRKHILNLMCHLHTSWEEKEMYLPDLARIAGELRELESDGLLEVKQTSVKVTELGRPFIRNVCMAFDLMLQRQAPETKLFSMTV